MGRITVESIPIAVGREEDGRWWADIDLLWSIYAGIPGSDSAKTFRCQ